MIPAQLIRLPNLGVLQATGADRRTYLQGQLTADLTKQPQNQWSFAGHCDPKGKLIAAFRLAQLPEQILMLMPQSLLQVDLPQLQKYAVFNQIELTDISAQWQCFAVVGAETSTLFASWQGEGNLRFHEQAQAWLEEQHAIVLIPHNQPLPAELAALPVATENHFVAAELQAVRPWFEAEHSGEFVPQMLNLDAVGGVTYDKGCYIGQETVARMYFRGGNKRALYLFETDAEASGELTMAVGDNWRRAGTIVSRAVVDQQQWFTAVLPKELPEQPEFKLGDRPAHLHPRPYPLMTRG
ncbi:MAG: hypothetical protein R3Y10_00070 [Ferrimonas sp.]